MGKLGLPDLVVNQHARGFAQNTTLLIDFAAQALWERGTVGPGGRLEVDLAALSSPTAREAAELARQNGAPGKTTLTLVESKLEEGDAKNLLFEIQLINQEAHAAVLKQLLGVDDKVIKASDDDAELIAASEKAKKELLALRPRFAKGVPELEHLMVKAPFDQDEGGVEYMWVEVTSWKGEEIAGILDSEPNHVKALKRGARVKVSLDAVFDYIHQHDGKADGNETSRILERRQ